jgi:hypothetical protein
MSIHQLQVVYQIEQDRILVRLNTLTGEEFRVSLTRRMMKKLFPHLVRKSTQVGTSKFQEPSHDGANVKALEQFKKQELLKLGDFQKPFSHQVSVFPIGEQPLLATTVHLNQQEDGSLKIRFEEKILNPSEIRNVEVTMNIDLLKGFMHLLDAALQESDWGALQTVDDEVAKNLLDDAFLNNKPKYLN